MHFPDTCLPSGGFSVPGITQFFFLTEANSRVQEPEPTPRKHSCVLAHWDSCGKLFQLELDNYKSSFIYAVLWERSTDYFQRRDVYFEGPCPEVIFGSSSASSDATEELTVGCILRCYALRSSYGQSESEISSAISRSQWAIPVRREKVEIDCVDSIESIDPTSTAEASEIALEFDSAGLLCRVYFGGEFVCDPNPCVWDRENPPDDKALVAVPILQFDTEAGGLQTGDKNWNVLLVIFNSTGHYLRTCFYMRLCECEIIIDDSSVIVPPGCPCRDVCVDTRYGCGGQISDCPATILVDPALVHMNPDCVISSGQGMVLYTFSGNCCAFVPEPDKARIHLSDPSIVEGAANFPCLYLAVDAVGGGCNT